MNVLLLGATGAVGRSCLQVLNRHLDASTVIAGRDETVLHEVAMAARAAGSGKVEIAHLDLTDAAAVAAAVPGYDVVINCAGPSYRLSAMVADAVLAAGVPYVDPGGDQALLDRLTAAAPDVPVVLQAGIQPGISGLLLRALAQHRTDENDGITVWCGGLQHLTSASVLEYLASLGDQDSHPGAALCKGMIHRVGRADTKPAPVQYFSDSATAHPHLDAETAAVAAHLGIAEVLWMNVLDGVHTTRAMQLLALDEERRHANDLNAVLAAAKLDLFGRRPYFSIIGSVGAMTVAFTCPDSYRITGAAAAFAAEHIANLPAGVRPFWRVQDPRSVLDYVTSVVPEAEITYADDSMRPMIDEGSL